MDITGFEKVAQYLTHPLALIGFVLMLVFGMHKEIVKSGLLPQVSKKDGSEILKLILRYGFWLGLVLVLAGFLLQFSGIGLSAWNSYMEKEKVTQVNAGKLAEKLVGPLQGQLQAKDEQIKALTEAITALSKTGAPVKSINEALQALQQGHTAQAQAIFAEVLRSKEAEGQKANKEAAAAAMHLGALAYMNNTKAALAAYQKAVQLDPDNADGWNELGHLFRRTGELSQAEEAYRKVLALGEAHQDKEKQAWAYGNLGNVAYTRGDLAQAEQMYKKSLEISEALGLKETTANQYGNLGNVYQTRGELDKAEEMYKKSLEISEALGLKETTANQYGNLGVVYKTRGELDKAEGMYRKSLEISEALGLKEATAAIYGNLGNVYQTRGELDKAEEMWKKSLNLYQTMQAICHPCAKKVQQRLDVLAQQRSSSH
ncbi:MAG: Tetratricopeptide repeat-containing protein [Candidatus Electronema aureum]|uniref:Tetratricopeptide repeat-containing protein n=1 Tax=Candidatus Electronema aureum TaxID=2005002 RepID=A0A521FZU1_9BACT|nr:MAG: Tetratricopeptide repeat-containing protein [Candidatus Electronema aureum]